MREEDAEFFNRVLTRRDIVFTYGLKPWLIERIRGPQRMFSRGSVAKIERELERSKGISFDYINYNPEHWKESHTPRSEIENLPEMVKRARELARAKGAKLSFATDFMLLEKYGASIAPYVDLFGVQLQRYQSLGLGELREQARRSLAIIRKGSKEVPVAFQFSLSPPIWETVRGRGGELQRRIARDAAGRKRTARLWAEEVMRQIDAVKDLANGIALIYTPETGAEMRRLVVRLSPRRSRNGSRR